MRRIIVLIIAVLALTGCGGKERVSDYERIHRRLAEMESYKTNAKVTYFYENREDSYETIQCAERNGRYKIENAEGDKTAILFDGKLIWLYNPTISSRLQAASSDKDRRREIILFTFLQNEAKGGEESVVTTAKQQEEEFIVFETSIFGGNSEYSSEKLFLEKKSGNPVRLVIYNDKGSEQVREEFSEFEYNPEMSDGEFKISECINKGKK